MTFNKLNLTYSLDIQTEIEVKGWKFYLEILEVIKDRDMGVNYI
jgi:hypothetical protein